MKSRKHKNRPALEPDFMKKQKASLVHNRRQVIYFNELEMRAIDEYCSRLKIKAKSAILRKMVMEEVLKGLDETHPTLF